MSDTLSTNGDDDLFPALDDLDAEHITSNDDTETIASERGVARGKRRTTKRSVPLTTAQVRRVAKVMHNLADADLDAIAVTAAALGIDETDHVGLTVALLTGKSHAASITSLNELDVSAPAMLGIEVATAGRERMKVWSSVLSTLGVDQPDSLNPSDAKAALEVTTGVMALTDSHRKVLVAAISFGGKR